MPLVWFRFQETEDCTMSKPKAIPVPEAQETPQRRDDRDRGGQEPLSGSHKAKIRKQDGHFNPEG
ncbi:small acid-soluble spore protein P (minor) [Paenibacillus lactis]|nr:small acid-soluble spore protein P (minor) [Paenibacillus lactis]